MRKVQIDARGTNGIMEVFRVKFIENWGVFSGIVFFLELCNYNKV